MNLWGNTGINIAISIEIKLLMNPNYSKLLDKELEKISRKSRKFFGCEGYPECDFVSWDKPVSERCPVCGSYMVEKHNGRGEVIHLCANENCRNKVEVARPEEGEDDA